MRILAAAAAFALILLGPAQAEPAPVTPLVTTTWLKANAGDADLVILDIRSAIDGGGREAYLTGHIPGAVHSDYDKGGWRVTRNNVPFMLPSVPELEKLIGELGIDEDNHVVVVPAGVSAIDFGSAARVYWTLKVAGHGRVSILDGGYAAWIADGGAVEPGEVRPVAKIFTVTLDRSVLAEANEVEKIAAKGSATLIDARPASFFAGKVKADRANAYGHIPGARNIDNAALYDTTANRLKPKAELASIMSALGSQPVVTYCNTGHWAATNWFVLSEILGRRDARLFAGSMVEWTSDARRPVASGRTKWDDLKKALGLGS